MDKDTANVDEILKALAELNGDKELFGMERPNGSMHYWYSYDTVLAEYIEAVKKAERLSAARIMVRYKHKEIPASEVMAWLDINDFAFKELIRR